MRKCQYQSFKTPNLLMRPLALADVDDFAKLYGNNDVMQFIGSGAVSKEKSRAIVEAAVDNWKNHNFGPWAVICQTNNQFIGRSGLYFMDDSTDIQVGCALAKAHWGQGLAKESTAASLWYGFKELGLDYIYACIRTDNTRSVRLANQLSMRFCRYKTDGNHKEIIYQLDQSTFLNSFSCPISDVFDRQEDNHAGLASQMKKRQP